jgi:hypothetical protein
MSVTTIKPTTTRRPLLIAAVLVVVLGAGLYLSGLWGGMGGQLIHEPVSQSLGAASSADVTIGMGLGQLRIGALAQSSDLIAGEIAYPDRNAVTRAFSINGETASFTLREQDSQANSLIKYRDDAAIWDLRLNPATPMRLTIETGVGQGTIDLAQLLVTDLDVQIGIGNTTLTLPRQGEVQARVEGGVGNTTIRVPAGVAVRLASTTGLGNISVPTNYWRQGDVAVSPDYETAANRVELTANGGIGNITIQPISE